MSTPILSSRFFKDHLPTSALYQRWREVYSWSFHCLPVYEWDGVLFVGCLQPPTDFPEKIDGLSRIVFVLCAEEALKNCWHEFEGTVISIAPRKSVPPKKENDDEHTRIPASILSSAAKAQSNESPLRKLSDSAPAPAAPVFAAEPTPPPVVEQTETKRSPLQPFNIDDKDHSLPSFKVDLANEKLTSPQIKASEEEYSMDHDSDRSINIAALRKEEEQELQAGPADVAHEEPLVLLDTPEEELVVVEEAPAVTEEPALDLPDFSTSAVASVDESDPSSILIGETPSEESAEKLEIPTEDETPSEAAPEGLFFDSKIEAPKFDSEVLKTLTSIKLEKTETKAEPAPAVVAAASASKNAPEPEMKKAIPAKTEVIYTKRGALSSNRELTEKQDNTHTGITASGAHRMTNKNKLADVVNGVFTEMAYHYQKSMILLVENEEARPWKWSENFHASGSNTISFATPNPFRVVSRTQKSYHGYVASNESNDKFFEEWNESKTPDHLTISPILIDENLVGFLLGFGDKSADNKNSLILAEKLATDIGLQIKRDPMLLRAA